LKEAGRVWLEVCILEPDGLVEINCNCAILGSYITFCTSVSPSIKQEQQWLTHRVAGRLKETLFAETGSLALSTSYSHFYSVGLLVIG
jgi:hypothetical protein